MGKMFDIHIEVGDVQTGVFYAKSIIGNNAMKIEHHGPNPTSAIMLAIADMEAIGLWQILYSDPSAAPYPFPGNTPPVNSHPGGTNGGTQPKKKDPVRVLPSELAGTPKGKCEPQCTSYDHFGVSKCATMCKGKK